MKKINQKGITLIALVVTIIVLIILAGISINLLFGDNGIIKKAQDAGSEFKKSSNEEEIGLAELDRQIDNYLNGINGGSGDNNNNNTPTAVTGPLGTPINTEDYGKKVLNYTAANLVWRVFYEDSGYIYLISETQDGDYPIKDLALCDEETYGFNPKDSSYVSGVSVSQQGKDLLPLHGGSLSSSVGTNSSGYNFFTSEYLLPNAWAMAYLCDTRENGPWEAYRTGPAVWAMGGPTVELFAASYNATHTNHQIVLEVIINQWGEEYGYLDDNTGENWFLKSENNGIYRLKDDGMWNQWWVAGIDDHDYWFYVVDDSRGHFSGNYVANEGWPEYNAPNWGGSWYATLNARPVVCIPKSSGFVCEFANEL